jgi:uncharacterized protein YndB with AHSA1/START domain
LTQPAQPGEFTYRRVHRATRELLFDCLTQPEHLERFWGPAGTSTPAGGITVDLRPGGVFETVMVNDADGSEYQTHAVYDEVRPPELLVWTEAASGMRVTSQFVALGPDRTEVRIHQERVPAPMTTDQARAGFLSSLDRLAAYLAAVVATGRAGGRATE